MRDILAIEISADAISEGKGSFSSWSLMISCSVNEACGLLRTGAGIGRWNVLGGFTGGLPEAEPGAATSATGIGIA